jgi:hypothetical protein
MFRCKQSSNNILFLSPRPVSEYISPRTYHLLSSPLIRYNHRRNTNSPGILEQVTLPR